jgi:hypothetical protein
MQSISVTSSQGPLSPKRCKNARTPVPTSSNIAVAINVNTTSPNTDLRLGRAVGIRNEMPMLPMARFFRRHTGLSDCREARHNRRFARVSKLPIGLHIEERRA